MLGSENPISDYNNEIVNSFQLSINYIKQNKKAFEKCLAIKACQRVVYTKDSVILQALYDNARFSNDSLIQSLKGKLPEGDKYK